MRKRNAKFRLKRQDGIYTVIAPTAASQDYTPEQAWEIIEPVQVAVQRLLDGTADAADYRRVGCAFNVGAVRAAHIKGNNAPALAIFRAAGQAMGHAERLKEQHGKLGLTGPGRQAVREAMEVYEMLIRESSPRQMYDAENEMVKLLAIQASQQRQANPNHHQKESHA